jgi:hypothetical protein
MVSSVAPTITGLKRFRRPSMPYRRRDHLSQPDRRISHQHTAPDDALRPPSSVGVFFGGESRRAWPQKATGQRWPRRGLDPPSEKAYETLLAHSGHFLTLNGPPKTRPAPGRVRCLTFQHAYLMRSMRRLRKKSVLGFAKRHRMFPRVVLGQPCRLSSRRA